jgi:hydroxymethylbilane synthase
VGSDVLALLQEGRQDEAEAKARKLLGVEAAEGPKGDASRRVVLGTRGSALALTQSKWVAGQLESLGASVDLRAIQTKGDVVRGPLERSEVGVFVREIERALVSEEVDLAVHSLKDLPTSDRDGLTIAAVPVREDPSDAVVTRSGAMLSELPAGSRVATSSPRRVAQLQAHFPDLEFVAVRGNVDTRLRKLSEGEFEALVLAYAGLARLERAEVVTEKLSWDICLPAPGQGALALQVRGDDERIRELVGQLDDRDARCAVEAERSCLARLGAGCSIPAGALGVVEGEELLLRGAIADPAGREVIRRERRGPASEGSKLGIELAEELLAGGGERILAGQRW